MAHKKPRTTMGQITAELENAPQSDLDSKIKKLENAITLLNPKNKKLRVPHETIYNRIKRTLTDYKTTEKETKGTRVSVDFLVNLHQGILDAGDYITHISERKKLAGFRRDLKNYSTTIGARLTYMDALIEVAYAASNVISQKIDGDPDLQQKKRELSGKPQVRYKSSDKSNWKTAYRHTKTALSELSKMGAHTRRKFGKRKSPEDRFNEATKTAYDIYKKFAATTYEIVNEGIPRLNDVVGKQIWATK